MSRDSKTIQYDSSEIVYGGHNITKAIETEDNVYFNESYVVVGKLFKAKNINATYNLTVIGDIEADTISINGDLVVNGNIKVKKLQCMNNVTCSGKVESKEIICDGDMSAASVYAHDVESLGNMLIITSMDIENKCKVERNIIAGEGISGNGSFEAENAMAVDYFDFDGKVAGNIYEIATMFMNSASSVEAEDIEDKFCDKLNTLLKDFAENIFCMEEDEIVSELRKCADVQKNSFNELLYLFEEIIRISYLNEIDNLKDYLLVKYAEKIFPEELKGYETIEHVFSMLIRDVNPDNIEYKANSLMEFMVSLKIIATYMKDNEDEIADKVFSSVGIRYKTVKKQFKGVWL